MRVSKPSNAAVCIISCAFPSARPSLISRRTSSSTSSLRAILSAQVAPTAPAPTTVTFMIIEEWLFLEMAAKIGTGREEEGGEDGIVVAANLNTPDQTVLSGDPEAVARAGERCKAAGAKRVLPLKGRGAFHSPLMAPAAEGLRAELEAAPFQEPAFPVVANATGTPVRTAAEARRLLAEQLTSPVRWVESMRTLAALAPQRGDQAPEGTRFVEIGPGTVLGGLLKRILPEPSYLALGTAAEVERFLA